MSRSRASKEEPVEGPGPAAGGWRDRVVAAALALLTLWVFWAGPVAYLADSKYTLVLAENILAGRGLALDRYFAVAAPAPPASAAPLAPPAPAPLPYQVQRRGEHVYLAYPNANAYLALPLVALLHLGGMSALDADGAYDIASETVMQRILACGLAALWTALLFLSFRTIAPMTLSVAATLVASLGSVVLSNATRALWTQTWAVLLVGLLCWQLLRDHRTPGALRPALVGSALAWLALVRPQAALVVGCVLAYLFWQRRQALWRTLGWMAPWCALVGAVNLAAIGSLRQPTTYKPMQMFSLEGSWSRIGYVLASPSRGLLVFMPWVLLALLALLFWRKVPARPVMVMALAGSAAYLVMFAFFTQWIGGHCYGPRLWTEVVPLLALAATGGLMAARAALGRPARALVLGFAILASGWALFVHARGAFAPETHLWNRYLTKRELRLKIVHDWSRAQFLEGLGEPAPAPPPPAQP